MISRHPTPPAGASVDYLGTPAAPVAIPVDPGTAGATIDALGHKYIALLTKITTTGSAAQFSLTIERSVDGSNWQSVHSEVVAAGVGTFSAYKPQIAVAANAGHTFGLKTDGFRYYRVTWMVDTVTGTPLGYCQYALSGGPI